MAQTNVFPCIVFMETDGLMAKTAVLVADHPKSEP